MRNGSSGSAGSRKGCPWISRLTFPASPIPGDDALEKGRDDFGERFKQDFAFFSGGSARISNVARLAPISHDPATGSGLESIAERHLSGFADLADEFRSQAEDHARFPFAGMSHDALLNAGIAKPGFSTEVPVGREEEEEIVAFAVFLPGLEDCLFAGSIVAAVAVEKKESGESMGNEVLKEAIKQVKVDAGFGRKGAGKVHVVMRIAQPHERRDEDAFTHLGFDAANEFVREETVGVYRHVTPVLLKRGKGKDHRYITTERRDLIPF